MSTVIAQMQAIISANTSNFDAGMKRADAGLNQFEKGAEKATKATSRFGGALQVFAGNVLTNVASRLLDAGKSALKFAADSADAASDIAESTSKVGVLLGAAGKQATNFANTSAKSFGVSKAATLDYVGIFANLMTATGQARSASAQYSVQLVKTAADLASFNNTSVEDALGALRSGLVGESEPLRRFGVQLSAAAIEAEVMGLGLAKSTKEITSQQKQLAILSIIKRQTAAASGDFARTADGAANSTRVLSARFDDLKAKVGEVTLPIKIRLIKIIGEFFDTLDRNQGKIRVFFQGVGERIQEAVDVGTALLTVFGQLPDSVQASAGSFAKIAGWAVPIAALSSNIAGMVVNFKQLCGVQNVIENAPAFAGSFTQKRQAVIDNTIDYDFMDAKQKADLHARTNTAVVPGSVGSGAAQAAIKAETEVARQGIRQAAQTAGAAAKAQGGMVAGQFAAAGAGVQAAFAGIGAALAPFVVTIGIVVAALAGFAFALGYYKTQIAKAEIAIARAEKPAITVVPLTTEEAAYRKARLANPKLPVNPKLDASIAAKDEDRRNQFRNAARTQANSNIDGAKGEIEKLRTKIGALEQDLAGAIEDRDKNAPRLKAIIASGRDVGGRGSAQGALNRLNAAVQPLDNARAELARQEARLKANEGSVGKLDAGDKKRLNDQAYIQGANDKRRQAAIDAKAAADAAAKQAAEEAKATAEAARKAREAQFKSLVSDVMAQRTKLKQLTAANKSQLQSANLGEMAQKFDKIDVRSGTAGKLAAEYLRLADAIKKAENAAAEKSRITSALAGLYDTVRTKVLLLRDSTIENAVSVEIFKKSYTGLNQAEKDRVKGIIALQGEEKRLSESQEAAKKIADAFKSSVENLNDAHKDAGLALETYKLRVDGVEDSTNPAILALERFKQPLFMLPLPIQLIVQALAGLNKQLFALQAADQHKKKIKELASEYQSLIHTGSEWSKFLIAREGSDYEPGIDAEKLKRLREEFEALSNVSQARGLERLRDRIRDMKVAVGEIKFPTTEARLAYEQFGKTVAELTPDVAAEVRKTAKEFDRLSDKIKKLEMIKQVGSTIKDVFRSAFETTLLNGQNFFQSLIDGFKRAIVAILAEKAAAAVASGAENLLGQIFKTKGEDGDGDEKDANKGKGAGSTYSAMSQALENAKRTPTPVTILNAEQIGALVGAGSANSLAPLLAQIQGGAGQGGFQIPGMGGGMASTVLPYAAGQLFGAATGAATAGIVPIADLLTGGAISKTVGKLFGGLFSTGGTLGAGKWGIAGEAGPELIRGGSSGVSILSNRDSRAALGGGGTTEIYNIGTQVINDSADRERIQAWKRARTQRKSRLL